MNERVVITGMGVITSIGYTVEAFCNNLKKGKSGISRITSFSTEGLKYKYGAEIKNIDFGQYFTGKELRRADRSTHLTLIAAKEAIDASGIDFSYENCDRCGVALGTTMGGMVFGGEYYKSSKKNRRTQFHKLIDYPIHAVGSHLCVNYQLRGPNLAVSTACSSGNSSISCAYELIKNGMMDVMISGGFDAFSEFAWAGFGSLQNMAKEKCRPFDKNRDGLLLGEGSGIIILESLTHSLKRGFDAEYELLGYGATNDAYHMTAPDIGGANAARAVEEALKASGLEKENIDYICAHGTGTIHNDAFETRVIKRVFGDNAYTIPMSSIKSMIGHTLGAAGAIEAIASALAIRDNFLPPTISYNSPCSKCDLDYVPNKARDKEVNHVLSNNFGFGGNNCSLIIGSYKN